MSEINIARQLLKARHNKKITQEELANYIGVSKAAVSKWESGISFPDITILPQLATFYNMSIDELMGYEPQMTKEEIKKTYRDLKEDFAKETWDVAWGKCEVLEKKYYSCFPFLLQLVVLYVNHAPLSPNPLPVYEHCSMLAKRIRMESDDINDAKDATSMEITCYLLLNEPMKALDLCDEKLRPMSRDTEMLGQIYQCIGNMEQSLEAYQVAMFQHLLYLVADAAALLTICDTLAKAEEIMQRTMQVIIAYKIDDLHPNTTAGFYIASAQTYCVYQKMDAAIDMLEHYTILCEKKFFPMTLHGDEFFTKLDSWFAEFDLGNQAPRSEELIRKSMLSAVEQNPVFAIMEKDRRYKTIIKRLTNIVRGGKI